MEEAKEKVKDTEFVIVVTGPGVDVKKNVDGPTALHALQLLWSPADVAPSQGPIGSKPTTRRSTGAQVAIGEFLSSLHATNNPEKIAGIALYVRDHLGQDRIQRADVLDWFATAGEGAPRNPTRDFQNAINRKLIAEDHAKRGHYYVTGTGVEHLRGGTAPLAADGLADMPTRVTAGTGSAAKKPKSKKSSKTRARSSDSTDGPMGQLQKLRADNFFQSPKTTAEMLAELETRGVHYADTYLTSPLQQLVRRQELRRQKKVIKGGRRAVWHYSNW